MAMKGGTTVADRKPKQTLCPYTLRHVARALRRMGPRKGELVGWFEYVNAARRFEREARAAAKPRPFLGFVPTKDPVTGETIYSRVAPKRSARRKRV